MYPNTFYRVSVKALIKNTAGEVLVLKENQNTWSLPGGGLDHGEDPERGVRRELKEELNIRNPLIKEVIATHTFYLEHKTAWLLWIVYTVDVDTFEFALGGGVSEARFIDPMELEQSRDIFERAVFQVAGPSRPTE